MSLDEISVLCVYSALAVYALAFIAYAIDLSKRSVAGANAARSDAAASAAPVEATVAAGAGARSEAHADASTSASAGAGAGAPAAGAPVRVASPPAGRFEAGASIAYGRSPAL